MCPEEDSRITRKFDKKAFMQIFEMHLLAALSAECFRFHYFFLSNTNRRKDMTKSIFGEVKLSPRKVNTSERGETNKVVQSEWFDAVINSLYFSRFVLSEK